MLLTQFLAIMTAVFVQVEKLINNGTGTEQKQICQGRCHNGQIDHFMNYPVAQNDLK